jgi:uncharacterized protein (DUF849 family)
VSGAPPLVIEAAINGGTPKAANPRVPRTIAEIVADACACLEAGASVIHNHHDQGIWDPVHDPEPYAAAWSAIRARHPGAVLYPTMGGGNDTVKPAERYAHVDALHRAGALEMSLVDPGSVSFGPVEPGGRPAAIDLVYRNSFADARYMIDWCRERGLPVHVSIFEPGFLRVALGYHRAGQLPPAKIQLYFGGDALPFGLPPDEAGLDAYLHMLERSDLPWMVGVLGGDCAATLARAAIARGGHVRVGLEDFSGSRRPTNRELVEEIVALAREAGRAVATPAQARAILGLRAA